MGKYSKWALALVAPLLLAGCLLIPGKFDSQLQVMNDGTYNFTYVGQMQLAEDDSPPSSSGMEQMPYDRDRAMCFDQINKASGKVTAYPVDLYSSPVNNDDDPDHYEERECSAEEIAALEQMHDNEMARLSGDSRDSKKAEDDKKNAAMSSIFGGAIPGDDEGLKKFAAKLAKYDGWNKVEYMGNNLFEVEYAVSGKFDQMFAFPTIPGATMQFPFVQIIRRSDGELEVLTPAMGGAGGLAGAMGPSPMGGPSGKSKTQPIDGTFTIMTDGEVLTNNTEDGLTLKGSMKSMRWKVDGTSGPDGSPRAIIKLAK
ncbi:Lipoprotein [Parasphingorhabdus sp. NYA22]